MRNTPGLAGNSKPGKANPKSEIRNPKQIRKIGNQETAGARVRFAGPFSRFTDFVSSVCFEFRISDFGFPALLFALAILLAPAGAQEEPPPT
jgi:hypothetical protein